MNRSGKILLGLAAIFAAGAALGVLYAPDKGQRTRHRLTRKGRSLYNSINDSIENSKDNLQGIRDTLKYNMERIDEEIERLSNAEYGSNT